MVATRLRIWSQTNWLQCARAQRPDCILWLATQLLARERRRFGHLHRRLLRRFRFFCSFQTSTAFSTRKNNAEASDSMCELGKLAALIILRPLKVNHLLHQSRINYLLISVFVIDIVILVSLISLWCCGNSRNLKRYQYTLEEIMGQTGCKRRW